MNDHEHRFTINASTLQWQCLTDGCSAKITDDE